MKIGTLKDMSEDNEKIICRVLYHTGCCHDDRTLGVVMPRVKEPAIIVALSFV